jgi:hypothetical protein
VEAAVTVVRCVNCGGTDTSWPTVVALVFAGVAAVIAARSLLIQSAEHKRLREELAKRADFVITIRPQGPGCRNISADAAELVTSASGVVVRFEVGVTNTGQKAAAHTVLNFLAPAHYQGLRWSGPSGEELAPPQDAPLTSEQLPGSTDPNGSRWLSDEIERVALRTPRVRWVLLGVDLPPDGEVDLPVRAKAESDDLPDDVEERVKDFVLHIRRA